MSEARSITRLDWLLIAGIIALVLPLRLWLFHNTEVTARDSIGYIRYALHFERTPFDQWTKEVLKKNHQHPGYPLLVLAVSLPVRAIDGATTPENLECTVKLISLVGSLLFAAAMFLLGRQFFDRPTSAVAAVLYQYLPVSAQHLSDGISEPVFLVLLLGGLIQTVHALRTHSIWRCAFAGMFTGFAYLVRPEGALILPAFGLTLIALQCRSAWRVSWGRFVACGTTMACTAALVGATYAVPLGKLTNKPSVQDTMTITAHNAHGPGVLFATSFQPSDQASVNLRRSLLAIGSELGQGFHYAAVVPALIGLWWFAGSFKRDAGFWALALYSAIQTAILIRLAMSVWYISDRHVMILVIFGSYFAAAALLELPRRVLAVWKKADVALWQRSCVAWSGVLILALLAVCLPKAAQRIHGNRAGNHAAGRWLAQHLEYGDHVEDDHAWSAFFSGYNLREGEIPVLPPNQAPTTYVVTTSSHDTVLNGKRHSEKVAPGARVVYHWPEAVDVKKARVTVYAQPRDKKINPWNER